MRCLTVLLLCCLLEQSTCRPQANQEYKDADVAEYDSEDGPPEDSPQRYEDAVADDKVSSNKDEDEVMESHPNRNYFFKHHGASRAPEEQTTKESTSDNERFSDLKSSRKIDGPEEEIADNDQEQPVSNRRYDRYNEPNNANKQFEQEMNNQRESGVLRNLQLIKRRDNAKLDENNDVVYEQEHVSKNDKNKRNFDIPEPIGQANFYNHYYNKAPTESREADDDPYEEIDQEDSNRGRRDTNDPDENNNDNTHDTKDKKDLDNFENEAEQAIIQRYVKKLSKKEVKDLMKTLSDDKRAILQQIIDNDGINQAINLSKREITKKAEAVEENNLMDGVQSDSNKISGSLIDFNVGNGITNDQNAITPTVDENFLSTKVDESKINRRSTDANEETVPDKVENNASTTSSTESVTAKNDNKREVNVNDLNNEQSPDNGFTNESQEASLVGLQDEPYVGSQDEDLSQLLDDDAQLHYDYRNPQKRDLMIENNADVAEPMKSLQESFSDSNNYENSGYFGDSNMMPLIRVKRRNNEHAVKKRAAAIFSENKVAYVPENEDEDNDEGNEIYDDGFFDRTANFAKSNSRGDKVGNARERVPKLNADNNQSLFKRSSADNVDAKDAARNSMSIGSDTDSVLSGVEGVDENLMYTGGCRQKRDVDITKLEPIDELVKFDMLSNASRSSLVGDTARPSSLVADTDRPETFGVSFNSDDAFGSPSKGYDGELGRYKRIRRLQQQSAVKLLSTTKTE